MATFPQPGPDGALPAVALHSRRYLGGKAKLAGWIRQVTDDACPGVAVVADLFAGTGAVAAAFADKQLITNDLLYSNYLCHVAWFDPAPYDAAKLAGLVAGYNALAGETANYMTDAFAGTYFSWAVCSRIGDIRADIEARFARGELTVRERALLITALLYAMDKVANTCGHYDAYRRGAPLPDTLELRLPQTFPLHAGNRCCQGDAAALAPGLTADLVYLDPPYNSRQYADAYHVLENVARWDCPPVTGVARKMDRRGLKSAYCTREAAAALEQLVASLHTKYIVLSYSNMARKGNGRSHARLTDEDILRILRGRGEVCVYTRPHKPFSAGRSRVCGHEERLFVCTCRDARPAVWVPSPFNYTGGKQRLLGQIHPHFPLGTTTFVDLFCGGGSVGLNAPAQQVVLNDTSAPLMRLYETLRAVPPEQTLARLHALIDHYGLSRASERGYAAYGCDSSRGLAAYNREPFLRLRDDYNRGAVQGQEDSLRLYLLLVYAFNNQLRFNRQGEYNLPVGKRDFNRAMQRKLMQAVDRLRAGDVSLCCHDFRDRVLWQLPPGAFVYADPPYRITCATYNEQGGWTAQDDHDLLALLDEAHARGTRWALSNVLRSKGQENEVLLAWLDAHRGEYTALTLDYSYANANYHRRHRDIPAQEVLIVNYERRGDPCPD